MNESLKTALNKMREMSVENNSIYHQYIPIITDNTSISSLGNPVLEVPQVANEFMSMLVNRIVYTQFEVKYFNNPLQVLEGDRIPLGYIGQEIYVNPAKGRKFNVDDFAGLLQKYEADVKVQYMTVNMDLQYPVTVSRHKLKQAFVSWEALDSFIDQLSNSLYNGAYIDEYKFTKYLVSGAYQNGGVVVKQITAPTTEATAKDFMRIARADYFNMQTPSSDFNAWVQAGGYGNKIVTWSNPEDIVILIRNDIRALLDVDVLASAFNIDKTTLLGNMLPIDNFNVYADDGTLLFDGSNIIAAIGDKSWFRIKRQDMYLDEFYNANNRTWQYYLNMTKMYQYSLFSNMIVYASALPTITITGLDINNTNIVEVAVGDTEGLEVNTTPAAATTPNITYTSSDTSIFTVAAKAGNNKECTITGVKAGAAVLTIAAGNVSIQCVVDVKAA